MTNETKWSIDPSHSEIAFKVKHLMIAHVKGIFKTFDARIYTMEKDFTTSEIELWIDASSISTGDIKRDEHLKSNDFFDVKNHKQITFISHSIEKADAKGSHELWGDLTIKGITKKVKLNVQFGGVIKDPSGNEKAGFAVAGAIKRSDWGLVWNNSVETGGLMVSDEITISCDIELINADQKELVIESEDMDYKKNSQ